jgi:hypothetical protein
MEIDDDTLKQLLRINDELMQLCKWLNEKRDMETSSRLIPLVDDLTHILIEAARTNYTNAATSLFGNPGLRTEAGDQWMVP